MMKCPLCFSVSLLPLPVNAKDLRRYFDCQGCRLVFLDRTQALESEKEKDE